MHPLLTVVNIAYDFRYISATYSKYREKNCSPCVRNLHPACRLLHECCQFSQRKKEFEEASGVSLRSISSSAFFLLLVGNTHVHNEPAKQITTSLVLLQIPFPYD